MITEEEWQAELERLRAECERERPGALAEAERRGIGDQMLVDALVRIMEGNELVERVPRVHWLDPAEVPPWSLDSDTPPRRRPLSIATSGITR